MPCPTSHQRQIRTGSVYAEIDESVGPPFDAISKKIDQTISKRFGISLQSIFLIAPGSLEALIAQYFNSSPRVQHNTSLKRSLLRRGIQDLNIVPLYEYTPGLDSPLDSIDTFSQPSLTKKLLPGFQNIIRTVEQSIQTVYHAPIAHDQPFLESGLTSSQLVRCAAAIGESTGKALPATLLFSHPTISDIAEYLLGTEKPGSKSELKVGRDRTINNLE